MTWEGLAGFTDFAGLYVKPVEFHDRGVRYGVSPRITLTFTGRDDAPDLTAKCEIVDGVPRVTELHIVQKPEGRPIRDADLHEIQLDLLARKSFRSIAMRLDDPQGAAPVDPKDPAVHTYEDGTIGRWIGQDEAGQWGLDAALQTAQQGPSAKADLERVAAIYADHINSAPTAWVAKILGLTPRTAARRVSEAAKAGLITERSHRGRRRYPDDFRDAE